MNKKRIDIQEVKTLITTKGYYRYKRDVDEEKDEKSIQGHYDLSAGDAASLFDQIKAEDYPSWRRNTNELPFELYDSEKEEIPVKGVKEEAEISNVEVSDTPSVISNTEEKEEETTKIDFKSSGF